MLGMEIGLKNAKKTRSRVRKSGLTRRCGGAKMKTKEKTL
jgi:hypothetical protein